MYGNIKIASIIPARAGSKGIRNKNTSLLDGKPLISHSIEHSLSSQYIDLTVVSTDSKEIASIARSMGIIVNGLRPEYLCTDTAELYDVIRFEINNNMLCTRGYDLIVLLQPTSPFRQDGVIDGAISDFVEFGQRSAVAVSEVNEHPLLIRRIEQNKLIPVISKPSTVRRQDLPVYYRVNGMLYINYISDIINGYVSFNDNESPIIIDKSLALDIDMPDDLKTAEQIIARLKEHYE